MRMKTSFIAGGALFLGISLAVYYSNRNVPQLAASRPAATLVKVHTMGPAPKPASVAPVTPVEAPEKPVMTESSPLASAPSPAQSAKPAVSLPRVPDFSAPVMPAPKGQKAPILDPDARAALSFVGADPDAEAYWLEAIDDPTLPAEERQDLIEDLNEDGLSNPKHPGLQDLPLIENRLAILQNLEPMDQVNADAIQEAAKDLSKMYADLTQH